MRTRMFLGYKCEDGIIKIHEIEVKAVKSIFDWYVDSKSLGYVAKKLHEKGIKTINGKEKWTHGTLARVLQNKVYLGDEMHPQIIEQKLFQTVQEIREGKAISLGRNYILNSKANESIYANMVVCKECGSVYRRYKKVKREGVEWRCQSHIRDGVISCRNQYLSEESIGEIVKIVIQTIKEDCTVIQRNIKKKYPIQTKELRGIDKKIRELEMEQSGGKELIELIYARARLTHANATAEDYQTNTNLILETIMGGEQEITKNYVQDIFQSIIVAKQNIEIKLINGSSIYLHHEEKG